MKTKLEKEVHFLKIYAFVMTLGCAVFFLTAFAAQDKKQKFTEIDVERINIVEKDGKLKMVISNQERQQSQIIDGKTLPLTKGGRPPGIIFFNHLGNEMGGLIYGENGGKGQVGSFTFDKVNQNETIGFRHLESDNGEYAAGLTVWQRPDTSLKIFLDKYETVKKCQMKPPEKLPFKS